MKKTKNLGLALYEAGDRFSITDDVNSLNNNMELIDKALSENAPSARIGEVALIASEWIGSGNLYSQVVNIDSVTENTQVDLTPSVQQLAIFYEKDITFVTENDGGTVTVYVIGQKPIDDYTVQVTLTEVQ